ncbi:MAG TPA: HAD-IIIA family hydrolase [Polyangiaceae bacterium]|nr:HAD-IIIA family hydrolase [Polyangiaceae bacterium]
MNEGASGAPRERYRLVIFDADGTLRRTTVSGQPCPHADGEWELIEGVRERLAELPGAVLFAVASNQDHVGYGLVDERTAHRLLLRMIETASGRSVAPSAVRYCPHRLEVDCSCRKPGAGMLRAILAHYAIAPEAALFVGDAEVDRQAAANAGVAFEWAHVFFRRAGAVSAQQSDSNNER